MSAHSSQPKNMAGGTADLAKSQASLVPVDRFHQSAGTAKSSGFAHRDPAIAQLS
jgi:hypothetical protein